MFVRVSEMFGWRRGRVVVVQIDLDMSSRLDLFEHRAIEIDFRSTMFDQTER